MRVIAKAIALFFLTPIRHLLHAKSIILIKNLLKVCVCGFFFVTLHADCVQRGNGLTLDMICIS